MSSKGVLKRLIELGAYHAEAGEFTKRAFLNGRIDLSQAEAVADLIDATTEGAARAATRSLTGVFSEKIHHLTADLIELRALIEAILDFPEEEIDLQDGNTNSESNEVPPRKEGESD